MTFIKTFTIFELGLLISLIPAVFIFLWILIFGDFKNFVGSRKACTHYTAKDPINCYQDYPLKGKRLIEHDS